MMNSFDFVENNDRPLEDAMHDVREFHKAFNHPHPTKITKISPELKKLRAKWMMEEIQEYLDTDDIAIEMDSLADLIYFALGSAITSGLSDEQFSHIFALVQEANMAKLFKDGKPHYNEDGKVIKPEGWIAPDEKIRKYIEEIISSENKQESFLK